MLLSLANLTKTYPNGVRALDNVSLTIERGLFGLLGPNGAGKSTLMRTIAALQDPDSGSITFDPTDTLMLESGSNQPDRAMQQQSPAVIDVLRDKNALRQRLGYLPQEFGFYPSLSAEATLDHFAVLKGITSSKERKELVPRLLAQVNLYDARKKNVGGFSGGMRQRLGIALALLNRPALVIVDEPTAGLDPTERHRFLNLLSEVGEHAIVILSTHIVEDVRELCERMAIIAQGRVIAQGSPESVIAREVQGHIYKRVIEKVDVPAFVAYYRVVSIRLVSGKPVVFIYSESDPGNGFVPVEADLEDAYFFYTAAPREVPPANG